MSATRRRQVKLLPLSAQRRKTILRVDYSRRPGLRIPHDLPDSGLGVLGPFSPASDAVGGGIGEEAGFWGALLSAGSRRLWSKVIWDKCGPKWFRHIWTEKDGYSNPESVNGYGRNAICRRVYKPGRRAWACWQERSRPEDQTTRRLVLCSISSYSILSGSRQGYL